MLSINFLLSEGGYLTILCASKREKKSVWSVLHTQRPVLPAQALQHEEWGK